MDENRKDGKPAVKKRRSRPRLGGKRALGVLLGIIIFVIGVGVGDGRLKFTGNVRGENNSLPRQLDYGSVNQLYQTIIQRYNGKLTEGQLVDGLKHGLAEATKDPYTVYFTPKEAQAFNSELNNSFSGIGAELGKDSDGNLQIIAPISGTPADTAGLRAKDIITQINGTTTSGSSIEDAVSKIRGTAGTSVKLQIVRDKAQQLDFSITRGNIHVPSVNSKILDNNIGYIQITSFADDTTARIKEAADKLTQARVKAIVLDLRDNPGGLLDAAVAVSSQWLPQGQTVVDEKGTIGDDLHTARGGDELHGIPTVVLINAGSASASEIAAGALHDNHAAYLIGEKSYGKGVVQQLINFGDGSQLKVTVASWYRPNGQNINHQGITPDQTVKIPADAAKAGTDPQLQAAESYLNR